MTKTTAAENKTMNETLQEILTRHGQTTLPALVQFEEKSHFYRFLELYREIIKELAPHFKGEKTPAGVHDLEVVAAIRLWPELKDHEPLVLEGRVIGVEANSLTLDGVAITTSEKVGKELEALLKRWHRRYKLRVRRFTKALQSAGFHGFHVHSCLASPTGERSKEEGPSFLATDLDDIAGLERLAKGDLEIPENERQTKWQIQYAEKKLQKSIHTARSLLKIPERVYQTVILMLREHQLLHQLQQAVWKNSFLFTNFKNGQTAGWEEMPLPLSLCYEVGISPTTLTLASMLRGSWPELRLVRGTGYRHLKQGVLQRASIKRCGTRGLGKVARELAGENESRQAKLAHLQAIRQDHGAAILEEVASKAREIARTKRTSPFSYLPSSIEISMALAMQDPLGAEREQIRRILIDLRQTASNLADSDAALWSISKKLSDTSFPRGEGAVKKLKELENQLNNLSNKARQLFEHQYKEVCMELGINPQRSGDLRSLSAVPTHWEGLVQNGRHTFLVVAAAISEDLSEESKALGHCVRGSHYVSSAENGDIALMLFRTPGQGPSSHSCPEGWTQCFTVEVDRKKHVIKQARGAHNRLLTETEELALQTWAKHAGIRQGNSESDEWTIAALPAELLAPQQERRFIKKNKEDELRIKARQITWERLTPQSEEEQEERKRLHGAAVIKLSQITQECDKILAQGYQKILKKLRVIDLAADGIIARHPARNESTPTAHLNQPYASHHKVTLWDDPEGKTISVIHRKYKITENCGTLIPQSELTTMRIFHGGIKIQHSNYRKKIYGWINLEKGEVVIPVGFEFPGTIMTELETLCGVEVRQDLDNTERLRLLTLWSMSDKAAWLRPRRKEKNGEKNKEKKQSKEALTPGQIISQVA